MNRSMLVFLLWVIYPAAQAQRVKDKDSAGMKHVIDSTNQLIDDAVVAKQRLLLQKHYAADFVFTHSTGQVDSKTSWIQHVLDTATHYASRKHDSVFVELHRNIAIVRGTLTVKTSTGANPSGYALRYIRVYCYKEACWQLLSHFSTSEWKLTH